MVYKTSRKNLVYQPCLKSDHWYCHVNWNRCKMTTSVDSKVKANRYQYELIIICCSFVGCPKSIASKVLVVWMPHQNVKSIRQVVFKLSRSQAISCIGYKLQCWSSNCCGSHLGFRRMPQINSIRGFGGIKAISKCEVNWTSCFQTIAFTSNTGHRVQC